MNNWIVVFAEVIRLACLLLLASNLCEYFMDILFFVRNGGYLQLLSASGLI